MDGTPEAILAEAVEERATEIAEARVEAAEIGEQIALNAVEAAREELAQVQSETEISILRRELVQWQEMNRAETSSLKDLLAVQGQMLTDSLATQRELMAFLKEVIIEPVLEAEPARSSSTPPKSEAAEHLDPESQKESGGEESREAPTPKKRKNRLI